MLGFYSVWVYFAGMATLLLVSRLPAFAVADETPSPTPNRFQSLDGLRGFLAFGVFFHHGTYYYQYIMGRWWLDSTFYTLVGQEAVIFFFMITGYLFWGKCIRAKGHPNLFELYIGRIFRIGPLYLFAMAVMFLIVACRTHFQLNVDVPSLVSQLAQWLALGMFGSGPDINSYPETSLVLAGVTWTLRFEWLFYASLILTAFAARRRLPATLFPALLLVIGFACLSLRPDRLYVTATTIFAIGMLCAALEADAIRLPLRDRSLSAVFLALLSLTYFTWMNFGTDRPVIAFNPVSIALLGLCFYLITSGATIFGLLRTRPAVRLGNVSYGVYLLQGLVLTLYFATDATRRFAIASPLDFWLSILLCGLILLAVATATHRFIERPGIELGRRLTAWLVPRKERDGVITASPSVADKPAH